MGMNEESANFKRKKGFLVSGKALFPSHGGRLLKRDPKTRHDNLPEELTNEQTDTLHDHLPSFLYAPVRRDLGVAELDDQR
ncbi:hypothetical protein Pmani_020766 [Petrolisthes manimaculis]|uniref:Uncharacterized protein n=1 Tax=Petrolisthes manimaculis TaxID=1843537 RepID=A0AAE1PI17_9EUCA|nr:hypothetical protein Pmani_020766 [Petrolisthes manimaculis]